MFTLENVFSTSGMIPQEHSPQNPIKTVSAMVLITRPKLESILTPDFQRELKITRHVKAQVKEIENTGIIPGTLLLGLVAGKLYRNDGQHRIWAALQTERDSFYAMVQVGEYKDMAELGLAAMIANSSLSRRSPDDNLKAMEPAYPVLKLIRRECPFIGYGGKSDATVMSMSPALQCWEISKHDSPSNRGSMQANKIIEKMTPDEAKAMCAVYKLLYSAWGNDRQYKTMWLKLNVTLVTWLWRALVDSPTSGKVTRLTSDLFRDAIAGLTADAAYMSWLPGRLLRDLDRSPCYTRIKSIIVKRLFAVHSMRVSLPSPPFMRS